MTSQNNGPTVVNIYPPSFESVAMYYVPRRFVPLSNLHSYLVRKTPTIVFPDKTDYNLYEVIFLFAAALTLFLILKIITFVTCCTLRRYKFSNSNMRALERERERERERGQEREREMKKGKGEKYANATRCQPASHLPPTHQSKFS